MIALEEVHLTEENVLYLEGGMTYSEVVEKLASSLPLENTLEVVEKALERERLVSTAIGKGIAIPHARAPSLNSFSLAVGIAKEDLAWEAVDGEPVRIVCLIVGPENDPSAYLSFLSRITTLLKEERVRGEVLLADSKKNIVNIFLSC